ncbi:MAG: helix-turn-helix transcriptional regulator [Clostridia bacterium]|nr:helix-turn-helix transcriptional regulator [Clostridia bacterium]
MSYQSELKLLSETFKKCRVPVYTVRRGESLDKLLDENFKLFFVGGENLITEAFFDKIAHNTIYRLVSSFGLCYVFLKLPEFQDEKVLSIGPYFLEFPQPKTLLEISEKYNIPPQRYKLLETFFGNIPCIAENSHLFVLLDSFAEHIWGKSTFALLDINESFLVKNQLIQPDIQGGAEDILINMKLMEERYAAENEMMCAVSQGQLYKAANLLSSFESMPFEKRLDDPLRNLKNYGIIMNTLLRKAAEQGGVHPMHLNEISSSYAKRIEQMPTVAAAQKLMSEMYHSYCLLVQKQKTDKFSSLVRKAVLMIDADISSDLSLHKLAAKQNINASYLSTIFKKETGQTVTEYINTKRIQLASQLLATTSLQIQTVALHCGIMDVQYFSKIFKKHTGSTPKDYREKAKNKGLS